MDRERIDFFLDSERIDRPYEPLSVQRVTTDILCGDLDAHLDYLITVLNKRKYILSIAPRERRLVLHGRVVLKRRPSLAYNQKPQRNQEAKAS